MTRTISPLQLVTGGDKRICHGVAMARDTILAAGESRTECGILDMDRVATFCNMVATWCYLVMLKKGLSSEVVARKQNLYEDNLSIVVMNNIPGKFVKKTRQSLRQGDKLSMEMFDFGMDPIRGSPRSQSHLKPTMVTIVNVSRK